MSRHRFPFDWRLAAFALAAGGVWLWMAGFRTEPADDVRAGRAPEPPSSVKMVESDRPVPVAGAVVAPETRVGLDAEWGRDATEDRPALTERPAPDPVQLCEELRYALALGDWTRVPGLTDQIRAQGARAVPALAPLLASGSPELEIEAMRLLVQIGDAGGLLLALGKILTTPETRPEYARLLAAFADQRHPFAADWLAENLGQAATEKARDRLFDLLLALRGDAAMEALEQAALNPSGEVHLHDSLDSLALRQSASDTGGLDVLLESEVWALREAAAFGLASIGSREAILILAEAAQVSADDMYLRALEEAATAYAQEALLALALEARWAEEVRLAAIRALARGGGGRRVQVALHNAAGQEPSQPVADAMRAALLANARTPFVGAQGAWAGYSRGELAF